MFGHAVEHVEDLATQVRIHEHQKYVALTGGENGFRLVRGEVDVLLTIVAEPATVKLNAQAAAVVDGVTLEVYAGAADQTVQETLGTYVGGRQELGYL